MAVPTRSSDGRSARNLRAWASVLLGLVGVAALPAAIAAAETTELLELVEAAGAIPVALVAGVAALALARGARRRIERTLGRVGGDRTARVGRALGVLALCLAIAGLIALGFDEFLSRSAE